MITCLNLATKAQAAPAGNGLEAGRRAGTGAEVADSSLAGGRLGAQPAGHLGEPPPEQLDVEDVGAVCFLFRGEQVEQQGAQAHLVQDSRDITVAGAVPAAAASVRKQHDSRSVLRNGQVPGQPDRSGGWLHFRILAGTLVLPVR